MSTTQGGFNVIENGLIYYMDAANPSSYTPGIGAVARDLIYTNNLSFFGTPVFNNANGGSFLFDSTNALFGTATNTVLNVGAGGTVTIEAFIKQTSYTGLQIIFSYGPWTSNPAANYSLGLQANSVNSVPFWVVGGLGNGITSVAINPANWTALTFVWANSTVYVYKNGLFVGNSTATWPTVATTSTLFTIGAIAQNSSAISYGFRGNIGSIRVYNRALSATEVLQNYNATKGRFGL